MSSTSPASRPRGRSARRLALAAGVTAAAVSFGVAAERRAIRRARSRPDPLRAEDLSERPGPDRRVRSFDGTELAVHVAGPRDAPAVVLVHGFSSDLTFWHFQWQRLSRAYRSVLYDQRGHGRSEPAAGGDYSLRGARPGPRGGPGRGRAGRSRSRWWATAWAAWRSWPSPRRHPEAFGEPGGRRGLRRHLGLGRDPGRGRGPRGGVAGPFAGRHARRPAAAARRPPASGPRSWLGRSGLAFLVAQATELRAARLAHRDRLRRGRAAGPGPRCGPTCRPSLVEMDLRHATPHIGCPALVVVGDVDRLTPPTSARALERRLPDARVTCSRGAGPLRRCPSATPATG